MMWASAKSVREERSKQRFALQDFSLIRVSLVRGKAGWRIGSAESEVNYFTAAQSQVARASISGVIKLLRQFVRGEVAHEAVFTDAKSALELSGQLPDSEVVKLKDLFGFRLLYHLGYIPPLEEYGSILNDIDWWKLPELGIKARQTLEKAKEVSHL